MSEKAPYPAVTVDWLDIKGTTGWLRPEKIQGPPLCQTRGYLVYRDHTVVKIASTVQLHPDGDEKETVGDTNTIPAGSVVTIQFEELEE